MLLQEGSSGCLQFLIPGHLWTGLSCGPMRCSQNFKIAETVACDCELTKRAN